MQQRTEWHDLLGRHCPRFGKYQIVTFPLQRPQQWAPQDDYKLMLSFDCALQRLPTWITRTTCLELPCARNIPGPGVNAVVPLLPKHFAHHHLQIPSTKPCTRASSTKQSPQVYPSYLINSQLCMVVEHHVLTTHDGSHWHPSSFAKKQQPATTAATARTRQSINVITRSEDECACSRAADHTLAAYHQARCQAGASRQGDIHNGRRRAPIGLCGRHGALRAVPGAPHAPRGGV
jgi:hypothetical protein